MAASCTDKMVDKSVGVKTRRMTKIANEAAELEKEKNNIGPKGMEAAHILWNMQYDPWLLRSARTESASPTRN